MFGDCSVRIVPCNETLLLLLLFVFFLVKRNISFLNIAEEDLLLSKLSPMPVLVRVMIAFLSFGYDVNFSFATHSPTYLHASFEYVISPISALFPAQLVRFRIIVISCLCATCNWPPS